MTFADLAKSCCSVNSASEQRDTASLRGAENYQKLSIRVENPEVDREDPVTASLNLRSHRAAHVLRRTASRSGQRPETRRAQEGYTIVVEPGEVFVVKKKIILYAVDNDLRVETSCS